MKLVAFRIQNYRSIIDSGWCDLSSDNLTAVIGQNESGKSAVLDALHAFYHPFMDDNSIRSDGALPVVSCRFKLNPKELADVFSGNTIPKGFRTQVKKNAWMIELSRSWTTLEAQPNLDLVSSDLANMLTEQEKELGVLEPESSDIESKHEEIYTGTGEMRTAPILEKTATTAEESDTAVDNEATKEDSLPTSPKASLMSIGYKGFVSALFDRIPEFIMFTDNASFLPPTIDIQSLRSGEADAEGYIGAKNFLNLTGLSLEDILVKSHRRSGVKVRKASKQLTAQFHDFWQQFIGKSENKAEIEVELKHYDEGAKGKAGKPYLVFWVKNGDELLHPNQRSKGLQWFLSFFLQLRASALPGVRPQVLLIDEPGQSLHIKAQKDILKVFESSRANFQIIYSTHSPYLIEAESIHRILAVQRSGEGDTGESEIFTARSLARANIDTLFPIYSLIGADLGSQAVIERTNNVILEEPSALYYLLSFLKLCSEGRKINWLPATGVTNVKTFVNLFLGWGIDFLVLVDDDNEGRAQIRIIEDTVYGGRSPESERHLMTLDGHAGIEDIFTKSDFKKYVLKTPRVTYHDANSKYVKTTGMSKLLLAIDFQQRVIDESLLLTDLSEGTRSAIKKLVSDLVSHLDDLEADSGVAIEEEP